MAVESSLAGWVSRMAFVNVSILSISLESGPAQAKMNLRPGSLQYFWPPYGIRPAVGLKPYVPQQRAGIRIEPEYMISYLMEADKKRWKKAMNIPAISVPTPMGAPRNAISAPSPPLEPPAPKAVFLGFSTRPKMLLCESAV